ncbi:hypothetical protein ACJX0J_040297, partial [Zea mays]
NLLLGRNSRTRPSSNCFGPVLAQPNTPTWACRGTDTLGPLSGLTSRTAPPPCGAHWPASPSSCESAFWCVSPLPSGAHAGGGGASGSLIGGDAAPSGDSNPPSLPGSSASRQVELEELLYLILSLHISWSLILSSPAEMDDVQEIEQRSQPQIFWTQEMSACALKYLAQLVADGIRVDKGFKSSHYNQCAKVVKERFQVQVSGSQVTNHLKTWRTRWSNICNYKKISSAHFDEQTGTILLDEKNYLERVQ